MKFYSGLKLFGTIYSSTVQCYGMNVLLFCLVLIVRSQQFCPSPDVPEEGSYDPKLNEFSPGDEVIYSCTEGFTLLDKNRRICRSNGSWSREAPFCDQPVKLKDSFVNPKISSSISRIIDGYNDTCFMWQNSIDPSLQLCFEEQAVVHAIRIFLKGPVKIEIYVGVNYDLKKCVSYITHIDTSQWVLIKCNNTIMGNTIRIYNIAERKTNLTICEVEAYVKDEYSCDKPPDLKIDNGYLIYSPKKATLICEEGYNVKNNRLVCTENSWYNPGVRCDEILCDPYVYSSSLASKDEWEFLDIVNKISAGTTRQLKCNTGYEPIGGPTTVHCQKNGTWTWTNATCTEILCEPSVDNLLLTPKGEWEFLDIVNKISAGTRRQLKCNTGYEPIGGPTTVHCEKNGTWTWTNATCTENKPDTSSRIVIFAAIGVICGITILILLGTTLYFVKKQRNMNDLVVYKSTEEATAPTYESEYATINYDAV